MNIILKLKVLWSFHTKRTYVTSIPVFTDPPAPLLSVLPEVVGQEMKQELR